MDQLEEENKNASNGSDVEESIFKRISIPRTLGNISMEKVEKELFGGSNATNYHQVVTGLQDKNTIKEEKEESDSEDSSSDSDSE